MLLHKTSSRFFIIVLILTIFLLPHQALAKIPNPIKHGAGDIKNSFASWPTLVLLGGAMLTGAVSSGDDTVKNHFKHNRSLGKFDDIAKWSAEPYVLDPAALLVFGIGEATHNPKISITGETLFEALLLTDASTLGLKYAFNRDRPNGKSLGFPSGHASSTFAVATALQTLWGFKWGLPFIYFFRIFNAFYL